MFSLLVLIILSAFVLTAIYYILGRLGIFNKVEKAVSHIRNVFTKNNKNEKGTK